MVVSVEDGSTFDRQFRRIGVPNSAEVRTEKKLTEVYPA